jgi:dTDP-4-amino-4,6-dideoxygalactose transaminase
MITHAGGTVVFADTDGATYTIDPAAIEAAITPRTVGIIPVHLYGQPADMGAIMAIANRHKLWVIEDCAQAHQARYKDQQVGTFGVAATYSFYPGKNLGAMGDAGAIVTNNGDLAERMAMRARHGGVVKHQHLIEGINSRLDGLQAAILSAKLPHLTDWTKARRDAAAIYDAGLNQIERVIVPHVHTDRTHVYHLYTIQHPRRDELAAHLNANGVQTAINYPTALPFLAAYDRYKHGFDQFPNAFADQTRILSLPIFAEITREQQDAVIDLIRAF